VDPVVENDEDIAQTLIITFPEARVINHRESNTGDYKQLPDIPLTMNEIERAVVAASSWKAPGRDGMPAVVWQRLWPAVKDKIFIIFDHSLTTEKMPRAKIVPRRKPDKPDYEQPDAYRPISLPSTPGNVLESIIAEHISYLVETHHLLPNNHFGARSTV
jgi:hypothetical protein